MPPPLAASHTFSFQVPTMPSSESDTALRKQEMGRPAIRAAVRQHGGGGHEPELGHVVVDALGVIGVVGIGRGDAGEHVLIALAGEEVAVLQRGLAEVGQEGVAGAVHLDLADQLELRLGRAEGRRPPRVLNRSVSPPIRLVTSPIPHTPKSPGKRIASTAPIPQKPTIYRWKDPPDPYIWDTGLEGSVNVAKPSGPDFFVNKVLTLAAGDLRFR